MKAVKWVIIGVASLLFLFFGITFFLPNAYYVERSVEISAPPVMVYSQVVDLEVWQEWNPWNKMDPDMVITYGEKRVGAGAFYSWSGEIAGGGKMAIIETEAPSHVRYELIFEGFENEPSYSSMILKASDPLGPTMVTWTFEGDVGNKLFARWMVVLMDRFVGASYEQGLDALKERCEGLVTE
ncbi:MAG TPA: SRPBCC family protein [Oceanipulchritudo sp.]|nr:SRPBCC family protein [Oceanipulchritudo sp.]